MRKTGRYAFMSHLDMMRALERAIRRSGLRLAFSEGFHPHPKISFAAPLSVGISSEGEIADIELMSSAAADEVSAKLAAHLPEGLRVDRVVEVTSDGRSLMSRVAAATYRIRIPVDLLGDRPLDEQVQRILTRFADDLQRAQGEQRGRGRQASHPRARGGPFRFASRGNRGKACDRQQRQSASD